MGDGDKLLIALFFVVPALFVVIAVLREIYEYLV